MKALALMLAALLVVPVVHAVTPKSKGIRIKTYSVNKKQIIVEFGDEQIIRRGMTLTAGRGCKLRVASIKGNKAILTTKKCRRKRLLKKGKMVKVYDYRTKKKKKKKKPVIVSRPKIRTKPVKPVKPSVLKNFEASFFFFPVDTLDIEGSKHKGSLDAGSSYGVSFRYGHVPNYGIGFLGGINFGWGQFINQVTLEDKTAKQQSRLQPTETTRVLRADDQGDFYYILPELNAGLGLFGAVYLYGGPNFSFPIKKALPNNTFEGRVGFQSGLGVRIIENFSLEGGYRWINYGIKSGEDSVIGDVDIARQWGGFVRASYLF